MTTTVSQPVPTTQPRSVDIGGGRFIFEDVSWDFYERTLEERLRSGRRYRITFDHGRMEVMTLGPRHEQIKKLIGRLIERYGEEQDIPVNGLGGMTCKRQVKQVGIEPDECYYITTPTPPLPPGCEAYDLNTVPPPDLAIEVDITRDSLPKHPVYAALGVLEIWVFDGQIVTPFQRQSDASYTRVERSRFFPNLSIDELNRFIQLGVTGTPQHEVVKSFVGWLKQRKS